ncbi:universal stress protein [Sphingomonas sp. BGYR3]|uniref:universal stress protein n=1 Tax=Sphingomonas sp. BGYR3 TaxID=2975483 RepID=UPI0021A45BF6|nr:universal stress protein [Sphingomonas sp. BGYR3]MDG5488802.1 universal stress protein [Sphingomonas sp. BGYR3]
MKNILVLIHDDVGQEARFQAALDLTRALDGHLTCIDVSIALALADDFAMQGGALLMADEQHREQANKTRMLERLHAEDVPYDWLDETGFLTPTLLAHAGLADLIVLNRRLESIKHPDMRQLVGDMVIKSGKPIIAVPETVRTFCVSGHALVAWDGSREAVAALQAATPLLAKAETVMILEIDEGSVVTPAEDGAEYLSRHDIKPVIKRERSLVDLPSTIILDTIEATDAAYVVMGGFGHSRFMEGAFGGVSRRMINECPVPLFLAH